MMRTPDARSNKARASLRISVNANHGDSRKLAQLPKASRLRIGVTI